MTGGTSVPNVSACPTRSVLTAPPSRSTSVSATRSCASTRAAAEHFCPA
jgi:hypothetical protein